MKKGHQFKTWKERWFVLTVSSITYFESQENQVQKVRREGGREGGRRRLQFKFRIVISLRGLLAECLSARQLIVHRGQPTFDNY